MQEIFIHTFKINDEIRFDLLRPDQGYHSHRFKMYSLLRAWSFIDGVVNNPV